MGDSDKGIVVCGLGAITAVGEQRASSEEFWTSLKEGIFGFQPLGEHFAAKNMDASGKDLRASRVAPVRDFEPARYLRPEFLKENRRLDPSILYGLSAAALAMKMSGLEVDEGNSREIGAKVSTGLGGGQSFEAGVAYRGSVGRIS